VVTQQSEFERIVNQQISWFAIPRKITLPVLIFLGVSIGHLLWHFATSIKIIAIVSGGAATLCFMVMPAVWGVRNSISTGINAEMLNAETFQKTLRPLISKHRSDAISFTVLTALMAVVAGSSAISIQLTNTVWQWMVLSGGAAVGFACYVFLLVNYWELQIQIQKELLQYEVKKKKELDELRNALSSTTHSTFISPQGWIDGPKLTTLPNDSSPTSS
jgi:hypothetical protein